MIRPGQSPETVFGENNNLPFAGVGKWLITRLVIDIIALDKRLRNMYPEEWEFMSMKEIIIKHYGLKAMQLIESVL